MSKALSKEERDAIVYQCMNDPVYFMHTFLGKWFIKETPWFHRAILGIMTRKVAFLEKYGDVDKILKYFPKDYYRDDNGQLCLKYHTNTLLMIPRNFAKTTVTRGFIIWALLTGSKKFVLFISQTTGHSKAECGTIRRMLEENELIHKVFGDMSSSSRGKGEGASRKWTEEELQLPGDAFLVSKSNGSQIRGMNRGQRPDLIILDDIEDEESVSTEEQRKKTRKWALGTVFPALDDSNLNASVICCGTLLHHDALLTYLERLPTWSTTKFGAVLPNGDLLWPERKTMEFLETKKNEMTLSGELETFYLEYMNEVRNTETAIFHRDFFIPNRVDPKSFVAVSLALDPAISKSIRADFCAFAVCGRTEDGNTYIIDTYAKRGMKPAQQVDKFFELAVIHNVNYHGVEAIAYQAALISMIQEEMHRRQHYFFINPIKHKNKKEDRIRGVFAARMANGYVMLQKREPELESQCLDFPRGHDDLPDAVAMAIMLLDEEVGYAVPQELRGPSQLGQDYTTFGRCP